MTPSKHGGLQKGQVGRFRARKIEFCPLCDPKMLQKTSVSPHAGAQKRFYLRSSPFKDGDYGNNNTSWWMAGLEGTAGILFFHFPSCFYLFALLTGFLFLPQTAFLAGPREQGQLQPTRGQSNSCLSPQDMLEGGPIFSARGVTLPALSLLWAANH